jgi:hypothetical protein
MFAVCVASIYWLVLRNLTSSYHVAGLTSSSREHAASLAKVDPTLEGSAQIPIEGGSDQSLEDAAKQKEKEDHERFEDTLRKDFEKEHVALGA